MSWFIINPSTGEQVRHVTKPVKGDTGTLYVDDLACDGLHDCAWRFHVFLAEHSPRPSLEDLAAFVLDGKIPPSFWSLNRRKLKTHQSAFAKFWVAVDKGYQQFVNRPATHQERYWTAHSYLWRMAIGKEQFYANKKVQSEEWLLLDSDLWRGKLTWARLRVFKDATADAWDRNGLLGFDSEAFARHFLNEGHYVEIETLREMTTIPEGAKPPAAKAESPKEPFRYFGVW
jgi:hypothetical protein